MKNILVFRNGPSCIVVLSLTVMKWLHLLKKNCKYMLLFVSMFICFLNMTHVSVMVRAHGQTSNWLATIYLNCGKIASFCCILKTHRLFLHSGMCALYIAICFYQCWNVYLLLTKQNRREARYLKIINLPQIMLIRNLKLYFIIHFEMSFQGAIGMHEHDYTPIVTLKIFIDEIKNCYNLEWHYIMK